MVVIKVIAGGLLGAGVGAIVGRSSVCSHGQCAIRNRMIPCILAGAFAGAVVGYIW